MKATLPDKFVGTLATSPSPLNVGLHDAKYKHAKNNIERGREAKGYRVGVYNTVSQLIMSRSVFVSFIDMDTPVAKEVTK